MTIPVVFFKHRWLPRRPRSGAWSTVASGEPRLVTEGGDIVATSYATLESIKAARELEREGIKAEVIDLRTLVPRNSAANSSSSRLVVTTRTDGGFGGGEGDRAGVRLAQGRCQSA